MQEVLNEVFQKYYKDVYAYLYSLSQNASLSEDLASEVFLEVVRSIASFRGESDMKTWLFAIARHRWFAYLRRKKHQVKTEELSEFCGCSSQNVEEDCQNRVLAERIRTLLAEEAERTREIVLMRMEGFSFYEIGEKYGISESSARVIEFRAKAKIRKLLKEEGFDDE